jgi:aminopeptidase N
MRRAVTLGLVAACGGHDATPDAAPAAANLAREVIDTKLDIDLAAMTGVATITFGASMMPGASLETEGLTIDSVVVPGGDPIVFAGTAQLDLGLPASDQQLAAEIHYHWTDHEGFTGISSRGYTLVWPYYCGNMFPCHSQPSDGTTFSLQLDNVPAGKMAVYPATIPSQAPSYQIAWAIDAYQQQDLGTTPGGTAISVWSHASDATRALTGTQHLVAAFDWFETTLGPYHFGTHYGSVAVSWPPGAFGGMEHHPFSHIGASAIGDEETNVHEAAHGWFGDGIRIKCWEDFVLSEGTVSYLAARALDVVAPAVGTATWSSYQTQLQALSGTEPVWPQSCGQVDVIKDNLFSQAPYMRGAFFYKGIADKIGATQLDAALAAFYQAHAGDAATMQDMLDTIHAVTGYDATACAQTWLLAQTLPSPGPCP